MSRHTLFSLLPKFGVFLIVANLLFLDIFLAQYTQLFSRAPIVIEQQQIAVLPTAEPTPIVTENPTSEPTTSLKLEDASYGMSSIKEVYISFGSGANETDEWADVTGLSKYINSSSYPSVRTVTFEASVHIPTGNEKAYVRLYNATDKHPVWFSEVSLEGGAPQLLLSSPIKLDAGNKLYTVQMKTSLKYPAILDQASLHMTLN